MRPAPRAESGLCGRSHSPPTQPDGTRPLRRRRTPPAEPPRPVLLGPPRGDWSVAGSGHGPDGGDAAEAIVGRDDRRVEDTFPESFVCELMHAESGDAAAYPAPMQRPPSTPADPSRSVSLAADAGGRTTTRSDGFLTRTVGRVEPQPALFVAIATYVVVGIAVPLAADLGRAGLISFGLLGCMLGLAVMAASLFAWQQASHRRHLIEWTSDLRKLDAEEFEWLVGEVLRREGWTVTETGRPDAADGNVDLRARRHGKVLLVQCKRWTSWQVGVDEVRKIAGTTSGERAAGAAGAVVTLSDFTKAAVDEARRLNIELVDGPSLLARIERARASEDCPLCGTPMVVDRSSRGWWLRCPRYPSCSGKRDLASEPGQAVDLLLGSP